MHVGGGVAMTYKTLHEKLIERNVDSVVLSTWNGRLDYFHIKIDPDFRLISASRRNITLLKEQIARADVVICPDTAMMAWMAFQCIRTGTPMIWVSHTNFLRIARHQMSGFEHWFYSQAIHLMFAIMTRMLTRVLTTSKDYLQFMQSHGYQVHGYIDQGFKTDIFKEKDSDEDIRQTRLQLSDNQPERPLILFAGRLSNEKRIDLLLDARPDNFILVIVGDGYLRHQLLELHNPQTGIVVVNRMVPQAELRRFYKAADLTVSASDFETYGMTIHESLLCGTPVVVQDAKGFRQQVTTGVNGLLIDYADSELACAKLQEAVKMEFDARPIRDPATISLVDEVLEVARGCHEQQPCGTLFGLFLSIVQLVYMALVRFVASFYTIKPPTQRSRLASAPASATPKTFKMQD
jgi:glycosyltransferase involved in cell wall biosynthesis